MCVCVTITDSGDGVGLVLVTHSDLFSFFAFFYARWNNWKEMLMIIYLASY